MKKTLTAFFASCRNSLGHKDNETKSASREFQETLEGSLRFVEKYKNAIAYDLACDWQQEQASERSFLAENVSENGTHKPAEHEMERQRRTEQLLELGKSYNPTHEPSREKDEPDLEP